VFLPVAAKAGLLPALDESVMAKAVAEAVSWGGDIVVSVNLSGETLSDSAFRDRVDALLRDAGLPPARLSVEILESSALERDEAALTTVHRLRDLGVRVTVDDFGAGFASLARLRALEPDVIKVDRSLVEAELDPDRPSLLLAGITDLAHRLGATVVAEGVETEVQLAAALAAGCDAVQGFLWGRPMTPEACHELLSRARDKEAEPASHRG
jgi:EAL domain-containing protein (putative c-di-GMP-specific phosphodiesterase class I)